MRAPRLLFIDSLRGVAAASVMLYHLYHATAVGAPPREESVGWLFRLMESGVEVFFVLSGFVICANVESAASIGGRFITRFYLRRSLRLDPVYWVVIALNGAFLFTLSSTHKGEQLSLLVVASNMFYLNNIFHQLAIVPVGWTLCFEVQFYLGFALLVWLTRSLCARLRINVTSVRWAVFLPMLAASAWYGAATVPMRSTPWALVGWHLFFLGATLRWATAEGGRRNWALFATAVATSATVWWINGVANIGFALATAGTILLAWRRGRLDLPLFGRPLLFLGTISYSLYLLHPFVGNKALRFAAARLNSLSGVQLELAQWALIPAGVVLCVATSWALHKLIEAPAHRLSRRVSLDPAAIVP